MHLDIGSGKHRSYVIAEAQKPNGVFQVHGASQSLYFLQLIACSGQPQLELWKPLKAQFKRCQKIVVRFFGPESSEIEKGNITWPRSEFGSQLHPLLRIEDGWSNRVTADKELHLFRGNPSYRVAEAGLTVGRHLVEPLHYLCIYPLQDVLFPSEVHPKRKKW